MGGYVARRLLLALPTLLGLSILIFTLVSLAPGDPAAEYARRTAPGGEVTTEDVERARRELGLDRPAVQQYLHWIGGVLHGDFGISFTLRTEVSDEIRRRLPATAQLGAASFALTVLLALPLGVTAAVLHRQWGDHLLRLVALAGASIPGFFLAYVLIALLATRLGIFPVAGRQGVLSMVLPAVALAVGPTALVSRLLRSSLLEVLAEDYIRTARSKGLSRSRVVLVHALRNAAIPVLTVLGWVLGRLFEGAVIIELIFAWPGLGRLTYEAISQRDYPMVQATVLLAGAIYVLVNLLVDVSYSYVDPRVRLGRAS